MQMQQLKLEEYLVQPFDHLEMRDVDLINQSTLFLDQRTATLTLTAAMIRKGGVCLDAFLVEFLVPPLQNYKHRTFLSQA